VREICKKLYNEGFSLNLADDIASKLPEAHLSFFPGQPGRTR
jgi:hypothetical protein